MSKLTIADIEQWIDNDEGLYNWWRSTRAWRSGGFRIQPKREFIRENRAELESCINKVLNGTKPAHFLAYGPL